MARSEPDGGGGEPTGVYVVGATLSNREVLARHDKSLWYDENIPCWYADEDESTARPFTEIRAELNGDVMIDAIPEPHNPPKPGEVRDKIMRDLGWDDETTRAMAEAWHRAHPDQYPTAESAMIDESTYSTAGASPEPTGQRSPAAPTGA